MSTIEQLIATRAVTGPDTCFLRFRDGDLTYGEVDRRSTRLAAGFASIGVGQRDVVAVLMPNCAEFVLAWFALSKLGAVVAPLNTAYRGPLLAHALDLTEAKFLITTVELADGVQAVHDQLPHLDTVILREKASETPDLSDLSVRSLSDLEASGLDFTAVSNADGDLAMLLFTSGTTGRSKACELSHRYLVRHAQTMVETLGLRSDDVLYSPFPLFHIDATVLTVLPALLLGATAAIGERFSVSGFWDEVKSFGATVFDFMGATLTLLYKQPPTPGDGSNPVRLAWGVPLPDFAPEFEERFDLRLLEGYGSTDAGIAMFEPLDQPRRRNSCGKPLEIYDVRLFGPDDREVPVGQVGEIVLRPREPYLLSNGYFRQPEATVASRRNLWFHTGDLARSDDDGYFYFVGRVTDSIRRRGENISALEVEELVETHPDVQEAAAFGVPSELSEEDVMLTVVARHGAHVMPAELADFCATIMPGYMVPRYIDVVASLPHTPTEKVEKHILVQRGVTPTTWDRALANRS
ncbi:AMP-binding protein [Dietzia lutea]|uniref:AMP-binding protein n=1 Tax=Dietzia lutea TaxID=546160 RepID=UPI00132F7ECF|nr:AMP-binding protein [Dietzia lutea]